MGTFPIRPRDAAMINSLLLRRASTRPLHHTARRLSTSSFPRKVQIYEVGARDGLQNEPTRLSPEQRIEFVQRLSWTGVKAVEAAAFVNPKLVPQVIHRVV